MKFECTYEYLNAGHGLTRGEVYTGAIIKEAVKGVIEIAVFNDTGIWRAYPANFFRPA